MVAFVYTRHALNTLGYFDGNIYPAYLEDTEMSIRQEEVDIGNLSSLLQSFVLLLGPNPLLSSDWVGTDHDDADNDCYDYVIGKIGP